MLIDLNEFLWMVRGLHVPGRMAETEANNLDDNSSRVGRRHRDVDYGSYASGLSDDDAFSDGGMRVARHRHGHRRDGEIESMESIKLNQQRNLMQLKSISAAIH
jgi:hypothetical protein